MTHNLNDPPNSNIDLLNDLDEDDILGRAQRVRDHMLTMNDDMRRLQLKLATVRVECASIMVDLTTMYSPGMREVLAEAGQGNQYCQHTFHEVQTRSFGSVEIPNTSIAVNLPSESTNSQYSKEDHSSYSANNSDQQAETSQLNTASATSLQNNEHLPMEHESSGEQTAALSMSS